MMKKSIKRNGHKDLKKLLAEWESHRNAMLEIESLLVSENGINRNVHLISGSELSEKGFLEQLSETGIWFYFPAEEKVLLTREASDIFGISEAFTPVPLETMVHQITADDKPGFSQELQKLPGSGKFLALDLRIYCEINGTRESRNIHIKATDAGKVGNEQLVIGIIQHISRRKKFEDELIKAKEKAEDSDKLKTIFLSNLSHEIRTPMNAIMGYAGLIQTGHPDAGMRKEFSRLILQKGNLLMALIDDVIELNRFETNQVTLNKKNCDINKIVQEVHSQYLDVSRSWGKEAIDIQILVPVPLSEQVFTDPGRLHQVLSNLLNNALKFIEKGRIEVGYELKENKLIQFFVKDTGPGLSKDEQKLVFNRLKLPEETALPKRGGAGLGLTLSKYVVQRLGGKIWVESSPGEGAAFYFTIPWVFSELEERHELAKETNPSYDWKDKVILIVEDDEVNAQFLEAVLSQVNAKIIHASTGTQAVDLCRSINKIDLVLMDIRIPEMNGYEASALIKSFRSALPIIAQTAFGLSNDRERCLAAGCDDYLSKPIDIEVLLKKINHYFNP
jgi:signal transduction histidine kinase